MAINSFELLLLFFNRWQNLESHSQMLKKYQILERNRFQFFPLSSNHWCWTEKFIQFFQNMAFAPQSLPETCHFLQSFKILKSLQSANFHFRCCSKITNEGLHSLAINLKGLRNLQSLSLIFDSCYQTTNKEFQSLWSNRKTHLLTKDLAQLWMLEKNEISWRGKGQWSWCEASLASKWSRYLQRGWRTAKSTEDSRGDFTRMSMTEFLWVFCLLSSRKFFHFGPDPWIFFFWSLIL